jgi:endonuclease YncB( thermonuclease family)
MCGKTCCNVRRALSEITASCDQVLTSSCGLILSGKRGTSDTVDEEVSLSAGRRTLRRAAVSVVGGAAKTGAHGEYLELQLSAITATVVLAAVVKQPLHKASDVMNLERLTIPAVLLAFAAALAAFDANAQVPRDCGGRSTARAEVARIVDGRSFLLTDGREVRLAAIETPLAVPGDEDEVRVEAALAAKTALEALILHREVDLRVVDAGPDRYGRLLAYVFIRTQSGDALVQHELVGAGYALVSPVAAATCRIYLRNAERDARSGGLGLWGDPYYVVKFAANVADVLAEQGRFALVHGRVTSVRESGGIVYVNFGRHWSEQFTVTLLKRNEGIFAAVGLPPKALAGYDVEVRGWIEERGGPAIEVTRPEQIEIVH